MSVTVGTDFNRITCHVHPSSADVEIGDAVILVNAATVSGLTFTPVHPVAVKEDADRPIHGVAVTNQTNDEDDALNTVTVRLGSAGTMEATVANITGTLNPGDNMYPADGGRVSNATLSTGRVLGIYAGKEALTSADDGARIEILEMRLLN